MGPFPGNWLAARIADRTPDLQVLLFLRVNCRELLLTAVSLRQFLPCKLGPPCPPPAINLYITCCSDCTTRTLHMPKPAKPTLSHNEVEVLKLKLCQKLLGLTMATSSSLILQICLIMALSLHCKRCRFVLGSGQVSLAWSMALRTQELYTWSHVL